MYKDSSNEPGLQGWLARRGIGPLLGFAIGTGLLVVIFFLILAAAGTSIGDFELAMVSDNPIWQVVFCLFILTVVILYFRWIYRLTRDRR